MNAPLLSQLWYRVSGLKPALRTQVRLHRHRYRGEVWYLLQDPASNRVHRFSPAARLVIAAMDGTRTVDDLWQLAGRQLGDDAPSQDELIQLLGQLHGADLLRADVSPDVAELFERGERQVRGKRRRSYANPMSIRIPLWDPDAFLNRIAPIFNPLWSRWGGLLWLAVVLPALFLLPMHWDELTHNFSDRVLATDNLVLIWLVFPLIKFLHEMGHATAAKSGGGEVHDMGIMVLVLFPVPYVEASSTSVFPSKYRRAVVGAAGMVVELFIAALALYVWLAVEPGVVRAVAYNVMIVAGVSTLLFNGNPLLRYDAYYILADLIEMPNLAQRSLAWWGYLLERHLLRVRDIDPPEATRGEKAWFFFYGLASSVYRVLVTVAIALFIATRFFFIGVILALWAVAATTLMPLFKGARHVMTHPRLTHGRGKAVAMISALVLLLVTLLGVVPAPFRTQAEGVVWLSEQATVRAGANGFLSRFVVEPGERVSAGQVLAQAYDPALDAEISRAEARVAELEARYGATFVNDRTQAQLIEQELATERQSLAHLRERLADLLVRAGTDGIFMAPQWQDLPGRYFRKGEALGYVTDRARPLARVVVPQEEIDDIRQSTHRVRVRMAERPEESFDGSIVRIVPAGETDLPSRALTIAGGGQLSTDPTDPEGDRALARMFQLDVAIEEGVEVTHYGQRVRVRFDFEPEPMASQWYRGIRRLFLTHFNV